MRLTKIGALLYVVARPALLAAVALIAPLDPASPAESVTLSRRNKTARTHSDRIIATAVRIIAAAAVVSAVVVAIVT